MPPPLLDMPPITIPAGPGGPGAATAAAPLGMPDPFMAPSMPPMPPMFMPPIPSPGMLAAQADR